MIMFQNNDTDSLTDHCQIYGWYPMLIIKVANYFGGVWEEHGQKIAMV